MIDEQQEGLTSWFAQWLLHGGEGRGTREENRDGGGVQH